MNYKKQLIVNHLGSMDLAFHLRSNLIYTQEKKNECIWSEKKDLYEGNQVDLHNNH